MPGQDPTTAPTDDARPQRARWLAGVVLLAALLALVTHLSEGRAFLALAERSQPAWLLAALALQALTYVCAGGVWHRALARHGEAPRLRALVPLGLAKLFTDQALPSAGLSGALVVLRSLLQRGVSRPAAVDALLVGVTSYFAAYAMSALGALAILALHGEAGPLVWASAAAVCSVSIAVPTALLALRSGGVGRLPAWALRIAGVRSVVDALSQAPRGAALGTQLFLEATALQLAIILLDAATLAVCLRSVGADVGMALAFPAFVIASAFATLAVVPGGIGTFEAACVGLLHVHGMALETALAGTLLLRGLTFWLPMLPGFAAAQRAARPGREPGRASTQSEELLSHYWSLPLDALLAALDARRGGLSSAEAQARLARFGPNSLRASDGSGALRLLLRQFRSPLIAILVVAAGIALVVREWTDAAIVLAILAASGLLGFLQEYRASTAIEQLRARVRTRTRALRDGEWALVAAEEIVPGDLVALSAGSLIPADGVLTEAKDLFVTQSVLTGESMPVDKAPGCAAPDAPLTERTHCVFMGTSVRSGTGLALIVTTGDRTELGGTAERLRVRPPETEFERGIRHYGYLLTQVMTALVVVVFAGSVFLERPALEALLFAMALAVGMSPELLPAIIDVSLARGARVMAQHGVIVRRLDAIENFGSMDVLCTDKTRTLTEGVLALEWVCGPNGAPSADALRLAVLNARLQKGLASPLDDSIVAYADQHAVDPSAEKLDEIPYDFTRKRMSVILREPGQRARLVMKGAVANVLACCDRVRNGDHDVSLDSALRGVLEERFASWSAQGLRVLALATGFVDTPARFSQADERALCLMGFLAFSDPPRADARDTLAALGALGVRVKVITGDNRYVAAHLADAVGIPSARLLTGRELNELRDEALWRVAPEIDLYAEVDPNQKERIILALKKTGHVVGYLGDGINDAPALHAADVGISVEGAVDVAREAADFVLLEHNLGVLREGIAIGRRSFANTLKYIEITSSANFGNMVSMAAASFFLPFLPLLAHQILLNNLLSDVPAMTIADDAVDPEQVARPRRFELREVRAFMLVFGLLSSVFDGIAFATFWFLTRAQAPLFRTAWFVESLLTELLILLIVRTRRPFWRSTPGRALWASSAAVAAVAIALPYLPGAKALGFAALPASLLAATLAISLAYAAASELAKRRFFGAADWMRERMRSA